MTTYFIVVLVTLCILLYTFVGIVVAFLFEKNEDFYGDEFVVGMFWPFTVFFYLIKPLLRMFVSSAERVSNYIIEVKDKCYPSNKPKKKTVNRYSDCYHETYD